MKPKRSKRVPKEGPGAQGGANTDPMGSKPGKTSKKRGPRVALGGPFFDPKWKKSQKVRKKGAQKSVWEEAAKKNRNMGASWKSPHAFQPRLRSRNTVFWIAREATKSIKNDLQNSKFQHPLAPCGDILMEKSEKRALEKRV